jgi:hypothetical protein
MKLSRRGKHKKQARRGKHTKRAGKHLGYKSKSKKVRGSAKKGGARGYSSISRRRLRKSKSGSKKRYTQRGRYGGSLEDIIEIPTKYDTDADLNLRVTASVLLRVAKKIADRSDVSKALKNLSLPILQQYIQDKLYLSAVDMFKKLFLIAYLKSEYGLDSVKEPNLPKLKHKALVELFSKAEREELVELFSPTTPTDTNELESPTTASV